MKTAKIMDGSLKIQLPSMKSAKNVDENTTPKKSWTAARSQDSQSQYVR